MRTRGGDVGMAVTLAVAVMAAIISPAQAWGQLGHRAVAQVAYGRLTLQARSAVERYLNGAGFPEAAVYPDYYRYEGGSWTSPLHYVNLPRDADGYRAVYCGSPPMCVVSAIANYTRLLTAEGLRGPLCRFAKGDEPCPLSFLAHFVGDIHQPLHAGYADDKDGNDVPVITFWGKSTNLHALWDSTMLERYEPSESRLVALLKDEINNNPEKVKKWLLAMDAAQWADESFHIVKTDVYRFQQQRPGTAAAEPIEITEEYYGRSMPIIMERLATACVRLAAILNAVFVQ